MEKTKKEEQFDLEEAVDDELSNSNLYEESMTEITMNETKDDGHDTDPFDRSGEYDEDVDLAAPPPITPEIPEISTEVLYSSLRNLDGKSKGHKDRRLEAEAEKTAEAVKRAP